MNVNKITQLSKTLKVTDLLCYVQQTRETGSAEIPAEIFCAIQIPGYIRGKLNGENVFITVERVGRNYKMFLRFHNGRAVSRRDFASVTNDVAEPKEPTLYAILETASVPYGIEPTVVAYVWDKQEADSLVSELFGRYTLHYFEVIEEDEQEVEGLPHAPVYWIAEQFSL